MGDNTEENKNDKIINIITVGVIIIGLLIGIYVLYKWFLKEEGDAKLLNKFAELVNTTIKLAVGSSGALVALRSIQPDDVQDQIPELYYEEEDEQEDEQEEEDEQQQEEEEEKEKRKKQIQDTDKRLTTGREKGSITGFSPIVGNRPISKQKDAPITEHLASEETTSIQAPAPA